MIVISLWKRDTTKKDLDNDLRSYYTLITKKDIISLNKKK